MKLCWWRHRQELWRHNLLFQITINLRKTKVAIFADIIKIITTFIKIILKVSEKVKRFRNYGSKCNLHLFLDITKSASLGWKNSDVSRTQGVYQVIEIFFESSLDKV